MHPGAAQIILLLKLKRNNRRLTVRIGAYPTIDINLMTVDLAVVLVDHWDFSTHKRNRF